jgi:hypothetical protein
MRREDVTLEMRRRMSPQAAARYLDEVIVLPAQKSTGEPTVPKLERDEHAVFENWLKLHGYAYRHSRTDKPTRETCGAPDFTVYKNAGADGDRPDCNQCLAIEFKLPGNKLSKGQEEWAAKYGRIVHVLATAAEAINLVKRQFGD